MQMKRKPAASGALALGLAVVVAAAAVVSCEDGASGAGADANGAILTLTSLRVTTSPDRTEYFVGEKLNTAGMYVKATFDDGSTNNNYTAYIMKRDDGTALKNGAVLETATDFTSASKEYITVTVPSGSCQDDFSIQVYPEITRKDITGGEFPYKEWNDGYDTDPNPMYWYTRTARFIMATDQFATLTFTERTMSLGADGAATSVYGTIRASFTFDLELDKELVTDAMLGSGRNQGFAVSGTYRVTDSSNYHMLDESVKKIFGGTAAKDKEDLPDNLKLVISPSGYRGGPVYHLYLTRGATSIKLGEAD